MESSHTQPLVSSSSEKIKKEEAEEDKVITVKLRTQGGEESHFKVKRTTPMRKIFQAFADRQGSSRHHFTFHLDGERIQEDATPQLLSMDEGDQIDVFMEQVGGESDMLTVKIADTNTIIAFKVRHGTNFQKIFDAYAETKGLDPDFIRFSYNGGHLKGDSTPQMLGFEDEAIVQASVGKQGRMMDYVSLTVEDTKGSKFSLWANKEAPLQSIFHDFHIDPRGFRIIFDGCRLSNTSTPAEYDMVDGDTILIEMGQVGGVGTVSDSTNVITIKIAEQESGEETVFRIKKDTKLQRVFEAYAAHRRYNLNVLRFLFDGAHIPKQGEVTPNYLAMKDGDKIDALVEQQGGTRRHHSR
eukprot:gene10017-10887_t